MFTSFITFFLLFFCKKAQCKAKNIISSALAKTEQKESLQEIVGNFLSRSTKDFLLEIFSSDFSIKSGKLFPFCAICFSRRISTAIILTSVVEFFACARWNFLRYLIKLTQRNCAINFLVFLFWLQIVQSSKWWNENPRSWRWYAISLLDNNECNNLQSHRSLFCCSNFVFISFSGCRLSASVVVYVHSIEC